MIIINDKSICWCGAYFQDNDYCTQGHPKMTCKPCPFCGNKEIKTSQTSYGARVWCNKCSAIFVFAALDPEFKELSKLIKKWNTRVKDED